VQDVVWSFLVVERMQAQALYNVSKGEIQMADITDAEAIRFINEQVRPFSEYLRDLYYMAQSMEGLWFGNSLDTTIGSNAIDDIADGREAEGVSRLTAEDISNFMTQVINFQDMLEGSSVTGTGGGTLDVVRKPAVRKLSINFS
jgi:hypothetical protein